MESRGESVWTRIEHIFEHLGCVQKTQWKREGKAHIIWKKYCKWNWINEYLVIQHKIYYIRFYSCNIILIYRVNCILYKDLYTNVNNKEDMY